MYRILLLFFLFFGTGCSPSDEALPERPSDTPSARTVAVDASFYPQIAAAGVRYFDAHGNETDFLDLLRSHGVNTVRLRLWVDPATEHSGLTEVRDFSQSLRDRGFQTWLTLHYSDTWADPGQQQTPARWRGLELSELSDSVRAYTERVVRDLQPDLVQIGNEINSGLLHPTGNLSQNPANFRTLLETAAAAVRTAAPDCQIMVHYAGLDADWWLDQINGLDYDLIGLSYYPLWHGKSLDSLEHSVRRLGDAYGKDVLIAETSYPFTLDWSDQTHNVVGLEEHLVLPDFPATPKGQRDFIRAVRQRLEHTERGAGFCYWGGEWIARRGATTTDGSSWENQALFDFEHRALPALDAFR